MGEAHLSDYLLGRSVCLLASIHQPFSWCCSAECINPAEIAQTTDHWHLAVCTQTVFEQHNEKAMISENSQMSQLQGRVR